MGLLKLAIVVAVLPGVAKGIQLLGQQCRHRFGRSFFTMRGFWLAAPGLNFVWWGYVVWA